ncbi:neurochondrin [Elysia marginata]|uniref:Neurochondrin n=1 Tax=Elysia marginata TaxID=1093978 RepID=A0AAV4IXS6_9GAST|nr:neurochondrin [Elysia marginata]
MYAAHAKKHKEETSKSQLQECLEFVNRARSDNDRFAALIEITHCIWAGEFTDADKEIALKAIDHRLLTQIINTTHVSSEQSIDLYKSIALSVFAALSIEPIVLHFPGLKDFMCLVNDILQPDSRYSNRTKPNSEAMFISMRSDCENIVFNISQLHGGTQVLVDAGTVHLLLDYFLSNQQGTHILSTLAVLMKHNGDAVFLESAEKLNDAISIAVEKLGQISSLPEKLEYAKILTSILLGFSLIEVTTKTDWVVPLASTMQKLMLLKLHPDDEETVLQLMQALVGSVGPDILDPEVTGSFHLLKAVVARVSVEIYMQLDGIQPHNASERHSKLDGAYKLLGGAVQSAAGLGEEAEADPVIAVYRKLVDTRDIIVEFLYSVADQELALPQNHSVVLISVRALAAILTEITEEPNPNLLKLLPFFNLLCQPVEYADDVILEVKNATQAALENIKMMGMNSILESDEQQEEEETDEVQEGASSSSHEEKAETEGAQAGSHKSLGNFKDLSLHPKNTNYSISSKGSKKRPGSKSSTQIIETPSSALLNGDACDLLSKESVSSGAQLDGLPLGKNYGQNVPQPPKDICLSKESIEEFRVFQEAVQAARSKPAPFSARKVSFSSRSRKSVVKSISSVCPEPTPPWVPGPDDILGFLLPAYMFLADCEDALSVMVESDSFQVVVNFLQRSLSNLLEGKVSMHPEIMTTNALSLVQHVHTASPQIAANLHCFLDLFEILMLSVPNLVNLPAPPPQMCLKVVETSLTAYKLQVMTSKKTTTLTRIKHSQARFFKAVVEYLKTAYEVRSHRKRPPSLIIAKDLRRIWSLLEESWVSCINGLSELVMTVEELQDVLVKSPFLAEFLTFLRNSEAPSLEDFPEEASLIVETLLPVLENGAAASDHICELILYNKGLEIAKKFNLRNLAKQLVRFTKKTAS